ncbi:hypothetical protein LCGC14_1876640, partial [marine sediment metagenome]
MSYIAGRGRYKNETYPQSQRPGSVIVE